MRQWHQSRPGWKGVQSGRSHISGGTGLWPSHSMAPRTQSQSLAQDAV